MPTDKPTRGGVLRSTLSLRDIATEYQMTPSGARRAVLRGDFGPFHRIGRRLFVRRESMLDAIRAREVCPKSAAAPPVPRTADWARSLLRRGPRPSPNQPPSSGDAASR